MLSEQEINIVRALQKDLPLVPEPYKVLAEELGMTEAELLDGIRGLMDKGCLKRISIALRHNNVGYTINSMVVWDVPEERVKEVGEKMAVHPRVTHCYDRNKLPEFDYNLYTMVHAMSEPEYRGLIAELEAIAQPVKYQELRTTAESKKIGMKYFMEDEI